MSSNESLDTTCASTEFTAHFGRIEFTYNGKKAQLDWWQRNGYIVLGNPTFDGELFNGCFDCDFRNYRGEYYELIQAELTKLCVSDDTPRILIWPGHHNCSGWPEYWRDREYHEDRRGLFVHEQYWHQLDGTGLPPMIEVLKELVAATAKNFFQQRNAKDKEMMDRYRESLESEPR